MHSIYKLQARKARQIITEIKWQHNRPSYVILLRLNLLKRENTFCEIPLAGLDLAVKQGDIRIKRILFICENVNKYYSDSFPDFCNNAGSSLTK